MAYNASLIAVKVDNKDGLNATPDIDEGVRLAVEAGASVINISLGGFDVYRGYIEQDLINAVNDGVTIVVSAGNDSADCLTLTDCSYRAVLPFLKGHEELLSGDCGWIVVGSVDRKMIYHKGLIISTTSELQMSGFSNRAGLLKDNFVVAVGGLVYASIFDNKFSATQGTSLTAPQVSGVVALMKEKFPSLTGKQIANIIFQTADDLGEVGIDDVYGHGLVNVKKAFELAKTL